MTPSWESAWYRDSGGSEAWSHPAPGQAASGPLLETESQTQRLRHGVWTANAGAEFAVTAAVTLPHLAGLRRSAREAC